MKTKNNYFGVSKALMLENFKLHWYLPVIIFALYFLSGIFPLIISEHNGMMASYAMDNYNAGFIALLLFAPIIVSCVMMGFMHKPAASFALHSQPYSKSRLFNTQILTGWLMLVVPIILTGVFFLIIMGSVEQITMPNPENSFAPAVKVEAYKAVDVLIWVLISISKMSFFYFMYTLAGTLVGSTVMQIICSFVLVNLVPSIVGLINLYSSEFILGYYDIPDWANAVIKNSNPLIRMAFNAAGMLENPEKLPYLWYFVAGIIFLVLARIVYSYAKLERVGDSMIFDLFESVITATVAAIGGALTALIFSSIIDGSYIIVISAITGLLLTFFVSKIVIERSIKIFSKRNLKILLSSFIVLTVFLMIFAFDVVGFSKRAVNVDRIESVVSEELVSYNGTVLSITYPYNHNLNFDTSVTDRQTIEKVHEFNRYILENNLCNLDKDWEKDQTVIFNYGLKGGGRSMRRYHVRFDQKAKDMFREIMTSDSVVAARSLTDKLKDKIKYISVDKNIETYEGDEHHLISHNYMVTEQKDIVAILEARDKDLREIDYTAVDGQENYLNSCYMELKEEYKQNEVSRGVYLYYGENAKALNSLLDELEMKYEVNTLYQY